jgi:hypothetical protein
MNRFKWIPIVAALVLAVVVGGIADNAGVAHGIAQSGKVIAPYPYPGWHPWFPGFFFAPFFFVFFGFLIVRGLFWRGGWHRGRCGYRDLDEWHRQAHEQKS